MESNLQGSLGNTNLSTLLAMIRSSSKTGILKLKYLDPRYNTNYTFFEGMAGKVQTLFAAKISSIMGGYGVPEEVLEHLRSQKRNGASSKLMITLEDGNQALSSDLIAQAFKRRMLMSLVPILQRTDGHFQLNLHKRVTLTTKKGVDPEAMNIEVSRRLDELIHYKKDITSLGPDDIFVLRDGKLGLSIYMETLSAYEIRLLSVFSEPITLLRALVKSRLSWDELLKTIATLEEKEIIKHVFSNSKLIASKLKKGKQQKHIDEFATIFDEDIAINSRPPPVRTNINLRTTVQGLFRNPFR